MPDLLNLQLDENDVELIVELLQNAPHLWAQQLADDIREQTGDLVLEEGHSFDRDDERGEPRHWCDTKTVRFRWKKSSRTLSTYVSRFRRRRSS